MKKIPSVPYNIISDAEVDFVAGSLESASTSLHKAADYIVGLKGDNAMLLLTVADQANTLNALMDLQNRITDAIIAEDVQDQPVSFLRERLAIILSEYAV